MALELPEDVAGAETATDPEDRGLGQRLARDARDDALVREDVGQRGRVGYGRRASGSPAVAMSAVGGSLARWSSVAPASRARRAAA